MRGNSEKIKNMEVVSMNPFNEIDKHFFLNLSNR